MNTGSQVVGMVALGLGIFGVVGMILTRIWGNLFRRYVSSEVKE